MGRKRHNPERRLWRGRSYRKGGIRVVVLRERVLKAADERASKAAP